MNLFTTPLASLFGSVLCFILAFLFLIFASFLGERVPHTMGAVDAFLAGVLLCYLGWRLLPKSPWIPPVLPSWVPSLSAAQRASLLVPFFIVLAAGVLQFSDLLRLSGGRFHWRSEVP